MAIKLKFRDALTSTKLPAEVKERLKMMEKGVFKSGNTRSVSATKAADIGLEKPSLETVKGYATKRGISFEEADMVRVKLIVASTEFVDLDGDIVRQDFEFTSFEANPAMPFCHNWDKLPVGAHLHQEIKNIKTDEYEGPALILTSLYAGEAGGQLAGEVFHSVEKGYLKGNSIGFEPLIITFYETDAERKEVGLGTWGIEINKSKLLECSPCLIPCNPLALVDAKASGDLSLPEFGLILESIKNQAAKSNKKSWAGVTKQFGSLASVLFPDEDFSKSPEEIVKGSLKPEPEVKTLEPLDLEAFLVQYEKVSTRIAALENEVKELKSKVVEPNEPVISLEDLLGKACANTQN